LIVAQALSRVMDASAKTFAQSIPRVNTHSMAAVLGLLADDLPIGFWTRTSLLQLATGDRQASFRNAF
jgi:hypothetical protein